MEGKRLLVDPVFCTAAPVSFVNKPFKGMEVYRPEDMPDIDWAILENGQYNEGGNISTCARIYGSGSQGIESGKNSDGSSF